MKNLIQLGLSIILPGMLLAGCHLPGAISADPAAAAAAQETQVAAVVAGTLAARETAESLVSPQPSLTLTPSLTFTPAVPMVSVSVETNCRTGPGSAYDKLSVLRVGQSAEVVGRAPGGGTWIIRNPDNPAGTCWLWGQYATLVGNWAGLPEYPVPPTPTPAQSFSFAYKGIDSCMGIRYIEFTVTNTGLLTWESVNLSVRDLTHGVNTTYAGDTFDDYTGCGAVRMDPEIGPGSSETTSTMAFLNHNPSGESFEATLTLCSSNGGGGTCLTRTITFSP